MVAPDSLRGQAVPVDGAYRLPRYQLVLDASALPKLVSVAAEHERLQLVLQGELGSSKARIRLWTFPRESYRIEEPEDLAELILGHRRRTEKSFAFDQREFQEGAFGYVTYAVRARARIRSSGLTNEEYHLFGVTEKHGYQLEVQCRPALDPTGVKAIEQLFREGISYSGPVRDHTWTDDEARQRWQEHTSKKLHRKLRIKRTKHYIILSNAGGDLFAKKMEECYKAIRKVYPFDDVEGQRLMPLFVFRSREEYLEYYMSVAGRTREQAARSKGHAWRDYYATYYEAPNDPVHIHEATHQIFANRLDLGGGGSWFQEGVAEYMSENRNIVRSVTRNRIKSGDYVPFKKLMVVPSLLQSIEGAAKRGGSNAGNAYTQAASIIAFLAESKFGKRRFQQFLHRVGSVRRGDLLNIERELESLYQVDVAGLEERWKQYWRR